MQAYSAAIERHMKRFYDSLSEKDRRRFAAFEAENLGHGGIEYVARIVGCHSSTIQQGREEIALLPVDVASERVRKKGGPQKLS